jgi:hypothetical protein
MYLSFSPFLFSFFSFLCISLCPWFSPPYRNSQNLQNRVASSANCYRQSSFWTNIYNQLDHTSCARFPQTGLVRVRPEYSIKLSPDHTEPKPNVPLLSRISDNSWLSHLK